MPLQIQPMMAQSSAQPFDDPEWIFEMKWDGYRALATIVSGHVSLWSRNGLRLDSKYPLIVQELEGLKLQSAILDGEIVALDSEGIPRFGLLQRFQRDRSGALMYLVFDLLYLSKENLMEFHYFGALMLGVYDKGRLQYVGHTGTGFSEAMLKDLYGKLMPYFTDRCPFTPKLKANAPVNKWVEPEFVCEVAFQEWTSDGKNESTEFSRVKGR
jgi:ATP-dependent DNA ligase